MLARDGLERFSLRAVAAALAASPLRLRSRYGNARRLLRATVRRAAALWEIAVMEAVGATEHFASHDERLAGVARVARHHDARSALTVLRHGDQRLREPWLDVLRRWCSPVPSTGEPALAVATWTRILTTEGSRR